MDSVADILALICRTASLHRGPHDGGTAPVLSWDGRWPATLCVAGQHYVRETGGEYFWSGSCVEHGCVSGVTQPD